MSHLRKIQVIIYRIVSGKPEFLLLRRPDAQVETWQGVTGGVEEQDSSVREAAVRELHEELGIKVDPDHLEGPVHEFEFITKRKGYEGEIAHEYCFAYGLREGEEPKISQEHSAMEWFGHKAAYERISYDEPKKVLNIVALQHE